MSSSRGRCNRVRSGGDPTSLRRCRTVGLEKSRMRSVYHGALVPLQESSVRESSKRGLTNDIADWKQKKGEEPKAYGLLNYRLAFICA